MSTEYCYVNQGPQGEKTLYQDVLNHGVDILASDDSDFTTQFETVVNGQS